MSVDTEHLSADRITFRSACRENTGSHFLDSGGAYGRSHQHPDIPQDSHETSMEFYGWNEDGTPETGTDHKGEPFPRGEIMSTLHTGAFLDRNVEIDRDLQAEFDEFAQTPEFEREDWSACLTAFLEDKGYVRTASDNVCNGENDLDQVYVWQVWEKEGEESGEWIYADEFIAVYFIHTGCDIRGGYGRPIFSTEPAGDCSANYAVPLDTVCEWYFQALEVEPNETPLMAGMPEPDNMGEDWAERANQSGEFGSGYSSYPVGEVMRYVRRCFPDTYAGGQSGVEVEVAYVPDGKYGFSPGDGSADEVVVRVNLFAGSPMI